MGNLSINEKQERYTNRCVTHYWYFPGPSVLSVNNRFFKETFQIFFYGLFLLIILCVIPSIRMKWTYKIIFIRKTDLDAAYCRIHANSRIKSTCIAIIDNLALVCLQLPFVITHVLLEYTTVIEASIDLANDLLRGKYCDAKKLQSPHRQVLKEE